MCETECRPKDLPLGFQNVLSNETKKPQSFLSSVFSSQSSLGKKNLFSTPHHEKNSHNNSSGKSQGFLSSVINSNQGLLNNLSMKFEAAFHMSKDNDSDTSSRSEDISQKDSFTDKLSDCSSQMDVWQTSLPLTKTEITRHRHVKHKGMKPKDRSVYGQPEIKLSLLENKTKVKELSLESLDTTDSGTSLGNSSIHSTMAESKLTKSDPFYVYRHAESTGLSSEPDSYYQSTSLESSDAESISDGHCLLNMHCSSGSSLQSWASSPSCDSQPDDFQLECMDFMKGFVTKIFCDCSSISFQEKAKFGELCQQEFGRKWFARWVNRQRVHSKQVSESTFCSLFQHFALVLFECFEADDFSPAKSLMNMCFTFYYETAREQRCPAREYLFNYLKDQPIWQSIRFWNAAFFDAVQCERANRHIPTREDLGFYSPEDFSDEKSFQENIVFGQLGTFTYNMFAFGLSKGFCMEFLQKQCTIASLSNDYVSLLKENVDRMYSSDEEKSNIRRSISNI